MQVKIAAYFSIPIGLLMLVLTACQLTDTPLDTSSTVTAAITPTPSRVVNTTSTPTIVTNPMSAETTLVQQCLTITPDFSSDFLSTGGLVFWSPSDSRREGLWFFPARDTQPYLIPSISGWVDAVVSPNGEWLAYYDWRQTRELRVIGAFRGELITRPWKSSWQNGLYLHWFDNNQLAIPSAEQSPGSLTLYNPFTDEEERIAPELPNLYDFRPSRTLNDFAIYNKERSHVLYMAVTIDTGSVLVLYDLAQEKELWHLVHLNAFRFYAAWSPDGKRIAIAGESGDPDDDNFEISTIDLQGEVTPLTDLSQVYDTATINTLSWSPNGRYLSFWLQNRTSPEDTTPFRLHILDTQTRRTIDTCLLGGEGGPLVWSPDSQQIAFESSDQMMAPHTLAVLDVTVGQAMQVLSESVILVGWVNWKTP